MVKYKGEFHAFLHTEKGIRRANYCGPGTQLRKRMKLGDKPINSMDAICQKHDIAYDEAKTPADIRQADLLMLGRMEKDKTIHPIEKRVIGGLMRGKILGEQVGLLGPEAFTELPGLHETSKQVSKKNKKRKRSSLSPDNIG